MFRNDLTFINLRYLHPMSYLDLPTPETADGKVKDLLVDCENRWGYVPNLVRLYALAPEIMDAEDVWSKGVMYTGFLPRQLKEGIATVVSATNDCDYCSTSHAHAYTIAGGDSDEALACKHLQFDDFDEKEQAALRFAAKSTADPKSITQDDIDYLREFYSEGEIVEIGVVVQQYMGYNWLVTMFGLELEDANPMVNQ
jgi:uncharacterized peroxidase-related enzyme